MVDFCWVSFKRGGVGPQKGGYFPAPARKMPHVSSILVASAEPGSGFHVMPQVSSGEHAGAACWRAISISKYFDIDCYSGPKLLV
jgi:hypothetical protein